jgi:citrate lyase subunit beta/citryl-CoA lyase
MMPAAHPSWRSLLFVPVNQPRFVARAPSCGADAVQLDLEDAVGLADKEDARHQLPAAVERLRRDGVRDILVRVNRPLRMAVRDLEVAVRPEVGVVALPKVASADHVRELDDVVSELEAEAGMEPGATGFLVMVETCDALLQVRDIARSSPRIVALTLGGEDFATDAGIAPEPELLMGAKQQTVYAARAAGVQPLGLVGTIAQYQDLDAFRSTVALSRRVGFTGASVIHPAQVPVVNAGFSPTDEEVQWAAGLVDAYAAALAEGRGAIEYAGAMVDEPMARRARNILATAERNRARA